MLNVGDRVRGKWSHIDGVITKIHVIQYSSTAVYDVKWDDGFTGAGYMETVLFLLPQITQQATQSAP